MPDGRAIQQRLRVHFDDYRGAPHVLPLGTRAGVPDRAATADTASILKGARPVSARLARDPRAVLLPPDEWPDGGRRRCMLLASSYPQLVFKAVSVGSLELEDVGQVATLRGVPIWGGGFAVAKDDKGDRWIAPLEWAIDLVNDAATPTAQFP